MCAPALSASAVYTVKSGDSLWKIAVKYEIGLSEIKAANPQIKNFDLIYVGDKVNIPEASSLKSFEEEVARLVNIERANRGLPALKLNWELSRVARYKSQDMIDKKYFSHDSPTYGTPFKMIESFGIKFSAASENIAYGQKTAAAVMKDWMNSPGHRSNILAANVTQVGVGAAKAGNGTLYWTQMFIRPR
ncbi:MAG: CAP domain-containing protein [Oscillospiraceae bacterium]|nr:CAP domain-containing protein [Oscillospiraceae bacterium]